MSRGRPEREQTWARHGAGRLSTGWRAGGGTYTCRSGGFTLQTLQTSCRLLASSSVLKSSQAVRHPHCIVESVYASLATAVRSPAMRTRTGQETYAQRQRHDSPIPEEVYKPWKLPRQQSYVFVNIDVVDTDAGEIRPGRIVRIENGLIKSITPAPSSSSPNTNTNSDDAIYINSAGRYLTPGLIDAHVHLASVPGTPDLQSAMATPAAVSALRQPYQCRAMLERGFTSARDCGGAGLALKEAIGEGVFPGPRLFISGHAISQTGGHGDRRGAHEGGGSGGGDMGCCGGGGGGGGELDGGLSMVVDGVPGVLAAARTQLRRGADFLKFMAGGGVASPTDPLSSIQFTADEMRAITAAASDAGTFATAHAYTPAAIRRAVAAGARGIEHGNLLDAATARLLADGGVFLTPTLVAHAAMADPRYAGFLPGASAAKNAGLLGRGLEAVGLAHEAGVRMCLGSDLLSFLGAEQLGEFGLRAGVLPAAEVLRHATVNPARLLGQEARLGQVREGFVADLLVLNANPLEDVTVFERPERHLLGVIKEGRVYASRWSKLPVDVEPGRVLLD
ncbi:hypothetical protein KVR01_007677 [Diaporthe batatas]|uniref:uncharacterized protein n=1 Tax=Diaporthe batatas TaxID=748121 RepID=UPI001D04A9CA|nr:uncharacterized protein KVR01_007677 [Diaporthe batatas]KAG8161912.1 hypothetical protein KVR01_007677 [Diaporthe batatas]